MPEVLRVRGYRFFFFNREGHEPRHIHVEQAERYAKFWLDPIELAEARGFRGSELRELYSIIEEFSPDISYPLGREPSSSFRAIQFRIFQRVATLWSKLSILWKGLGNPAILKK